MIKVGILLLIPLAFGCVAKSDSDVQKTLILKQPNPSQISLQVVDTIKLDYDKSKLYWKGTKMKGTGSHEGEVRISKGWLIQNSAGLTGGKFELDMTSISITGIPKTDPIPIKNLTEHLMHADFFDVDNFPTSEFEITGIVKHSPGNLEISGDLTICGITKNISFSAVQEGNYISTRFLIDRFDWNIAYEGSWADRTLVDRDIEFRIELVLLNKGYTEIM